MSFPDFSCFNLTLSDQSRVLILRWVPEITHHCQKTPFLLVGTQIDLRDDAATIEKLGTASFFQLWTLILEMSLNKFSPIPAKNKQKPLSLEMGERLAKELRAVKYVECSALTQKGLKNVFDEVRRDDTEVEKFLGFGPQMECKREASLKRTMIFSSTY